MLAFITVIGNREHDQDGDSMIKVYTNLANESYVSELAFSAVSSVNEYIHSHSYICKIHSMQLPGGKKKICKNANRNQNLRCSVCHV